MTGNHQWSLTDDDDSPDLYDESLLLEAEKASEAVSSPDRGFSSAPLSHWSGSWSKPTEICRNVQEPQNDNHAIIGAGLDNLGNTCFLNSVLQCFIHTVPLLEPILSNEHFGHSSNDCNKERFSLLCALQDLIRRSLVSNTSVSPYDLVNNLTHISSNFQRFQQEDAHEFLQCFLDRLEDSHKSESKDCMPSQSDNIVQQVFGGRLVSNLKCCNCGHCSDTYEPSIDLSLEIGDADNLVTALYSFTKVEKIEDPETKFTCEKCKEQVDVEKKLSFDRTPSVAVLHLKRFENNGSFVRKIDKHIAFPLDLDLEPFTGSGKYNYEELQYVLYAVVVHIGFRPTSGHYYCFIRLSSDMWCKFDDSNVEVVHEDYVLSQEAYVLFYAKENTPWFSSFIETRKEFVNSTTWNTSPKSVLDTSSVSPSLGNTFGCNSKYETISAHEEGNDNKMKDSRSVQDNDERKAGVRDLQEMSSSASPFLRDSSGVSGSVSPFLRGSSTVPSSVSPFPRDSSAVYSSVSPFPRGSSTVPSSVSTFSRDSSAVSSSESPFPRGSSTVPSSVSPFPRGSSTVPSSVSTISRDSSTMSLPKVQKVSPILLEKLLQNQEDSAFQNSQNDIETAFRSPSPEIYREDSPGDAGFTISRSHLRTGGSAPCKRRLEKDMDDERKQACSFMNKNMSSKRRQQLMAAMKGSQTEPSANGKRIRKLIA